MNILIRTVLLSLYLALAGCAAAPRQPSTQGDLRTRLERADQALREARLTDAEILYRELTLTHPQLPEVWLRLGNIYARQSQLEAAMRSYKDGMHYASADGRLWYNLALVELKQAIQTLETSSTVLPADSPYRARIQQLHDALLSVSGGGAASEPP